MPHFLDRVAQAEQLLADPDRTPDLPAAGRRLLFDALGSARHEIGQRGIATQLIHGEPHPGNILTAQAGPRFIDFETCCIGPVEFDVAHAPLDVGLRYLGLDQNVLSE